MENTENTRRERSPAFPYFGLDKSVGFARQLYQKARRSDARLVDIAGAWGFSETSSSLLRTAAALIAFGLVKDSGSGGDRRVTISELGMRILEDARPGAREAALKEAAARVPIIKQVRERWGSRRPDDDIAISTLKFDFAFGDIAARRFLDVYDETVGYLSGSEDVAPSDLSAVPEEGAEKNEFFGSSNVGGASAPDHSRSRVNQSSAKAWFVANLPSGPTVSVLSDTDLSAKNLKSLIRLLGVLLEEMEDDGA